MKVVAIIFKALAIAAMILTPLLGVWVASSLAAYGNGPIWATLLAGLLLFPILPGAWELAARMRRKKPPILTTMDRLILRTLGLNLLFLVFLLAAKPQSAFAALSTRGDWMLGGSKSGAAETTRRILFGAASKLEWLYLATRDNPYQKEDTEKKLPDSGGGTLPTNTAKPPPPPPPSPSSTAKPEPPPKKKEPRAWPFDSTLHPVVKSIPPESEASIELVGKYIAAHESDPFARAKALHDWVADRIAYDVPAYRARNIPPQDAQTVFQKRIGVCAGYAKLLEALGKSAGLEIAYLTGDARTSSHPLTGEGHAWNAVKLDGSWYLIDATWDAGGVSGDTFKKEYSSEYFLTPPSVFAITHYPDNARWQLMEAPVARGDFFRRPMMSPSFYAAGLELVSPDRSQIDARGSVEVTVKNPRGMFLSGRLGGSRCQVQRGDLSKVTCSLPAAGQYQVELFANEEEYGSYRYIGQLQVNARD